MIDRASDEIGRDGASRALDTSGFDDASRLPKRRLSREPADADAWQHLGAVYRGQDRPDDALRALLRAALTRSTDQDLHAAIAEVAILKPSPDIYRAAWASNRLVPGHMSIATHWRHAAAMLDRTGHPDLAHGAAWEAQRLAGDARTDEAFASSRRLAEVDFAPSTNESAMDALGYSTIRGAVSEDQVRDLRRHALAIAAAAAEGRGERPLNAWEQAPTLLDVILQPAVLRVIRRWLGDRPLLSPIATAASSLFTIWHTDTARMPGGGRTFDDGRRTLMLTTLLYLQENRPFAGGGLDVAPATHRQSTEYLRGPTRTIASSAGDLVVFDSRIAHRGSRRLIADIDTRDKVFFSLQWGADAEYGRRAVAAYGEVAPTVDPSFLAAFTEKCHAMGVGVIPTG